MRNRWMKLAVRLLATTALGVGAIELEANVEAHLALNRLLARTPALTVSGIAADPFTGRLALSGIVSRRSGGVAVEIGRLDLPLRGTGWIGSAMASPFDEKSDAPAGIGPLKAPEDAPPAPPAAAPPFTMPHVTIPPVASPSVASPPVGSPATAGGSGHASAQDIQITNGSLTYRIRRVDLTATNLTDADLAKLLDPKSDETLDARIKRLNAGLVKIPEIVSDDPTIGSERHSTMTDVTLTNVSGGRIQSGSVAGIIFSGHTGADTISGTAGPVSFMGLDLAQILHVTNKIRTDESEPMRPMLDDLTAENITFTNETSHTAVKVASIEEKGVQGRALRSTMFVHPGLPLSPLESRLALDDLINSSAFTSFEVKQVTAQHTETNGTVSPFRLGSFTMRDFESSRIGGLSVKDISFESKDGSFKLGSFDLGAFRIPSQREIATGTVRSWPELTSLSLNDFVLDAPSDGQRVHFGVQSISLTGESVKGKLPKSSELSVQGFNFVLPVNSNTQPFLDMGYHALQLSFHAATSYDAPSQTLQFRDVKLQGQDMGSIAIALTLNNVSEELVSTNMEIMKAAAMSVLAHSLSIDVVNGGLIDRAIALKAKQDNVTVDAEKQTLLANLTTGAPPELAQKPAFQTVRAALTAFIMNPKTFHITITSKLGGLGVGSAPLFADPGLLLETLDIQASANQ